MRQPAGLKHEAFIVRNGRSYTRMGLSTNTWKEGRCPSSRKPFIPSNAGFSCAAAWQPPFPTVLFPVPMAAGGDSPPWCPPAGGDRLRRTQNAICRSSASSPHFRENEKKSQQARCIFLNNWIEVCGIHLLNKQNKTDQSGAGAAATSGRAGVSQGWRAWSCPRASPGSLRAAGPGLSEGALPTCWGGLGAPGPGESSVLSHRRGYEL